MPIVDPSLHAKTLVAADSPHAARRRRRCAAAVVRIGRFRRDHAGPHRHAAGGDLTRTVVRHCRDATRGPAGNAASAARRASPDRSAHRRRRGAARAFAPARRRTQPSRSRDGPRIRAGAVRHSIGRAGRLVPCDADAAEQDGAARRGQSHCGDRVARTVAGFRVPAAPAPHLRVPRIRARRVVAGGDPQRDHRADARRTAGSRGELTADGHRHCPARPHSGVRRVARRRRGNAGVRAVTRKRSAPATGAARKLSSFSSDLRPHHGRRSARYGAREHADVRARLGTAHAWRERPRSTSGRRRGRNARRSPTSSPRA